MNKKLNFLAVLPAYGSIILFVWLLIKTIKEEINQKKFVAYSFVCGFSGAIPVTVLLLILLLLKPYLNITGTVLGISIIVVLIISGYIMNLFTFIFINKKWEKLKSF